MNPEFGAAAGCLSLTLDSDSDRGRDSLRIRYEMTTAAERLMPAEQCTRTRWEGLSLCVYVYVCVCMCTYIWLRWLNGWCLLSSALGHGERGCLSVYMYMYVCVCMTTVNARLTMTGVVCVRVCMCMYIWLRWLNGWCLLSSALGRAVSLSVYKYVYVCMTWWMHEDSVRGVVSVYYVCVYVNVYAYKYNTDTPVLPQ